MVTITVLCLALGGGAPLPVLVIGAGALVAPAPTLLGLAGVGVVARLRRMPSPGPDAEAAFLHGVATELTGGASLRSALAAAPSAGLDVESAARAALSGIDAGRVAGILRRALPVNGRMAAAAWLLAAESGGPAAGMFQALAVRAAREGELIRERHALTAQARASAWVVAGLPVVLLAATALSGRLDVSDPVVAFVVSLGVLLQGAGAALVVAMMRKASR